MKILNPSILIVIPAYNEATVIAEVIKNIKKEGYTNIVVIDDCSKDTTAKEAKKAGATVISHKKNQGAGAATRTGLKYAYDENYDYAITMDADGQHDAKDIKTLVRAGEKYDVVIGSRMLNTKGMPLKRKLLNFGGSILTLLIYGLYVKDSQSGFKLFTRNALPNIRITQNGFEFCSEIIYRIRKANLSYIEVPISTIYTEYSLSKGQHGFNGIKMALRMIKTRRHLNTSTSLRPN